MTYANYYTQVMNLMKERGGDVYCFRTEAMKSVRHSTAPAESNVSVVVFGPKEKTVYTWGEMRQCERAFAFDDSGPDEVAADNLIESLSEYVERSEEDDEPLREILSECLIIQAEFYNPGNDPNKEDE